MAELFTIELSDEAARRARETASRKGRRIEAVLSEWIERSALAEEFSPLIPGVEYPIFTLVGKEAAAVLMELLEETKEADKKAGK